MKPLFILLAVSLPLLAQRQMENLDRGVNAQRTGNGSTYVGWRMVGSDDDDIAFNLYRSINGGAGVKLNATPLSDTTDYQDNPGSGPLDGSDVGYFVRAVVDGVEQASSASWTLSAGSPVEPFFDVPFAGDPGPDGPYDTKFVWVGDFDGNGEFDFLCDRLSTTGANEQFLEAYLQDGTFLWRMHMGPNSLDQNNIEPGSSAISIGHGDNVSCFDLNGDGHAEAIVRTSNGVTITDDTGATVGAINHSNNADQFLTVVDGMTGAVIDSAPVPNDWPQHGSMNHKCFIAYLDGKHPSVILFGNNRNGGAEFYYQWTAWDLVGGSLVQRWTWGQNQAVEPGAEGHQIRIADVDNDGRDEIVDIGHVVDDDGSQLYVIDVTHGDRFHVADIHPLRPGLETFLIQQTNPTYLATAYVSAEDGTFYKKWYSSDIVDVGRGLTVDMDPNHLGMEMFSTQPGIFNADATPIFANSFFPYEGLWWDDDTGREFIIGTNGPGTSPAIAKFNPSTGGNDRLYLNGNNIYDYGVRQSYGGRPAFWGDILGDWREELVFVKSDFSGLRIISTNTPADDRRRTLMHNAQYRVQTTTKGYVQGSYVDYYLGFETTEDPPPPIDDTDHTWVSGPTFNSATCPDGESILFDLSGDNSQPVSLIGSRSPSRLKVFSPIDYTIAGSGSFTGDMTLLKAGSGALTLTGNHTFTGATTIWDGALILDGSLSSSPVTIHGGTWGGPLAGGETGGRLGGSGTIAQPVTLAWRGAITPGDGNGDAATLQLDGGLTCREASVISLDLVPGGSSDLLAITGDLTLEGTTTLVIHPSGSSIPAGSYPIITYSGNLVGGLGQLEVELPTGIPYSLTDTGSAVELVVPVTRAPDTITWSGGLNGNAWNLFDTPNFLLGGAPEPFVSDDAVRFDDSGAPNTVVELQGELAPASVLVDSAEDYTFSGEGHLGGDAGLTKSGSGTLHVGDQHAFTGAVTVTDGTLAITHLADGGMPSSIGAAGTDPGNLVLNGGTLRLDGPQAATNRGLRLESNGGTFETPGESMVIGGTLTGPGSLTKTGVGTLVLGAANNYSGGTFLDDGILQLASDNANAFGLGSAPITFRGGTLSMTSNSGSYNSVSYDLVVPAGQSGRLNADARVFLGGTLTGSGEFTLYSPFVRTDLQGDWSAFTGTLRVITDGDGGDFRIDNLHGYAGATVDLGPDIWAYYMPTMFSDLTIDFGALSGDPAATLNGGPTSGQTLTWRIGANNTDATYAGTVNNGGSTTALTKIGTGIQTFSGTLNHSGDTVISDGVLRLDGDSNGSDFVVQSGGTLGGTGTVDGDVTLENGASLELGASPLTITGSITASGTITIQPLAPEGSGTYTVATYSGSFNGNPTFAWDGTGTATFASIGGQITVTVSAPATRIHHYTFNDDSFTDLVGSLNGTTNGNANLTGGALVLTGGTGELDAATLAINSYGSASFEFWATPDDAANSGFHALLGLGEVNPSAPGLASNYVILTTHRGDDTIRGAIATNNQDGNPWTEEQGVATPEINDASEHHYVLTVSGNQLELFVDGVSVDQQPSTQSLANVATAIASIGSLYPNDAEWEGSVNEFAIYSGVLTAAEVAAAYSAGPVPNPPTDSDGDLIPDAWETTYFPSPTTAGPLDDTDGDGFNTWTEWKAGTNPDDFASQPGAPTSQSVTIESTADTAIWHRGNDASYAANNYGSDADIDNYSYPSIPIISLGYFRFDLSALPPSATVDSATLTLTKAETNPAQAPQAGHSIRADGFGDGRFAIYGLLDVAGNTAQDWDEFLLTGDASGDEFDFSNAGTDPPLDTTTRTIDLDGVGEVVDATTASIADGALLTFLQGRLDAVTHRGLATLITDIEDGNNGKGYAFASREAASGRPTLEVDFTGAAPLPDTDEDEDGLDDAWEAHHFGDFDETGTDDPDGDSFDNEAEEAAGTDPNDGTVTPEDTDGDGLEDSWELTHFTDLSQDGDDDSDTDGTPEWLEQALGLDPNNASQRFHASIDWTEPAAPLLVWPNAPGILFEVESSDTLIAPWQLQATYPGSEDPTDLEHPLGSVGTRAFFRVRATPSP